MYSSPLAVRFAKKWKLNPSNQCWEWTAAVIHKKDGSQPRGVIRVGERNRLATYASWLLRHGTLPEKDWILHKCDNTLCVNPDHLYLGDHGQNMKDMAIRRRTANLKLTEDQVRFIRSSPLSLKQLAKLLNVSFAAVGYVRRGKHHKTVV